MSTPWSELEDISAQVEDANEAARSEVSSQRAEDWAEREDERAPSRAEAERERFEDWLHEREASR